MGKVSLIEWTDSSFSPWVGCTKVSRGCENCYAEPWAKRYNYVVWGPHAPRRRTAAVTWNDVRRWSPLVDGHRRRIFAAELADVFDNQAPAEWRVDFWALVRESPQFDWMILTKRIENARKMLPPDWGAGWPHVWLGISAEDQEYYDRRWPTLAASPAAVRFVSYEPALGPLVIGSHAALPDWLICGGESGPQARPMDPAWARAIRDECRLLGVAFFMKQMAKKAPIPPDLLVRAWPASAVPAPATQPAPEAAQPSLFA